MERRQHHCRTFTPSYATSMLAAVIGLAALAGQAWAVNTTTVTVTGTITQGTCDISAGDLNKVVALDPLPVSNLPVSGAAGTKVFTLTVDNCSAELTNAVFTFSGTPDTTDGLRFKNTGTAPGVAVELESTDGVNIGANGTNNSRMVTITGGQAVLNLQAAYWRLPGAAVGAGSVSSVATVNTTYN